MRSKLFGRPWGCPEPSMSIRPEFHSKAFLRGCPEHGIHVGWRPPGTPRYDGHIERLIGNQMGAVHALPGTGRSVADRQGRDAQARATLTMRELERWLLLEIAGKYHQRIHASLNRPPIAVWRELSGSTPLRLPPDRLRFWVAFLAEERRVLRRDGIHLFGIRYWSSALSQDVGRTTETLTVRYDPRDLSSIFVRRPNGHFVEAPYRTHRRRARVFQHLGADVPVNAPEISAWQSSPPIAIRPADVCAALQSKVAEDRSERLLPVTPRERCGNGLYLAELRGQPVHLPVSGDQRAHPFLLTDDKRSLPPRKPQGIGSEITHPFGAALPVGMPNAPSALVCWEDS